MSEYNNETLGETLSAEMFVDDPPSLRRFLETNSTLEFSQYPTGMFPASALDEEMAKKTGMGEAWFRDSAHVAIALYEDGQTEIAVKAASAMLQALVNNETILDEVRGGYSEQRLPVRFNGLTLENDHEPRSQNDATGYALWCIGKMANEGNLELSDHESDVLRKVVDYLGDIEYWHDADDGHWEEDRRVQISSIGTAVAGLKEMRQYLGDATTRYSITELIQQGNNAIHDMIKNDLASISTDIVTEQHAAFPRTTITAYDITRDALLNFSVQRRQYDAAMLFLVEPLDIFDEVTSRGIVENIEKYLKRDKGVARYQGDTYWAPRFPTIMSIEERTSMAEGRTDKRNQLATGIHMTDSEAQWTLFDSLLSEYYGKEYMKYGAESDREKQLHYLTRSLQQLQRTPDGKLQLPEAYYQDYGDDSGNEWVANDHMPLTWSTANLLRAVRVFEATAE